MLYLVGSRRPEELKGPLVRILLEPCWSQELSKGDEGQYSKTRQHHSKYDHLSVSYYMLITVLDPLENVISGVWIFG